MKGLYVIIDPQHCLGRDPLWVAEQALRGGCAALQLRAKQMSCRKQLELARALSERCRDRGVPFWLNDRVDLALLSGAHGVHLGQDDLSLADARLLAPACALGLSTHSLAQAIAAEQQGADAIGFGPIFATSSKLDPDPVVGTAALAEVCRRVRCAVIAIGGITLARATEIARSGARYAAVIGAVCSADEPLSAARALHEALLQG
jgi:thiamine-phosphate pyrophosphorylase